MKAGKRSIAGVCGMKRAGVCLILPPGAWDACRSRPATIHTTEQQEGWNCWPENRTQSIGQPLQNYALSTHNLNYALSDRSSRP